MIEAACKLAVSLRVSRVFLIADIGGALAAALRSHGVIASDTTADGPYDLAICLNGLSGSDLCGLVAALALAAPRSLVTIAGDDARVEQCLMQFSTAGLSPALAHDTTAISPCALLMERTDAPPARRETKAHVEIVRQRVALHRRVGNDVFAISENESLRRAAHRLEAVSNDLLHVRSERDMIVRSTMWRATRPLRALAAAMAPGARRRMRETIRRLLPGIASSAGSALQEYQTWIEQCGTLSNDDRDMIRDHIAQFELQPLISVIVSTDSAAAHSLSHAIDSVRAQLYPHWELCITRHADLSEDVARILVRHAADDPRIAIVDVGQSGDTAAALNAATEHAAGTMVLPLGHADRLAEEALYEVAVVLNDCPETELVYGDEDRIDAAGQRHTPHFKTDWDSELMLGHDAVGRGVAYRREAALRVGGFRSGLKGFETYDLTLRIAAVSDRGDIRHIPAVLYHRREAATPGFPADRDQAARHVVENHLRETGVSDLTRVLTVPALPHATRVQWLLPEPQPRVSVIVPTRDRAELLSRCARGLLERTDYHDLELIIVDNGSTEAATLALLRELGTNARVRVLAYPGPFNYSAINNAAAAVATGEILVLVNNDIDVIDAGWLRELVSHAVRPAVGAVGARLLFGDGTVQHAGVVLGVGTIERGPGVAGHFAIGSDRRSTGYFGQSVLTREVCAVTAACMAMRKSVFEAAGGLDEKHLAVAFNDVDLCLRIREQGLRIVWTPFAELFHLESASRGSDFEPSKVERFHHECRYMRRRWGRKLDNDPFYNLNFARNDGVFDLSLVPRRAKPWERWIAR